MFWLQELFRPLGIRQDAFWLMGYTKTVNKGEVYCCCCFFFFFSYCIICVFRSISNTSRCRSAKSHQLHHPEAIAQNDGGLVVYRSHVCYSWLAGSILAIALYGWIVYIPGSRYYITVDRCA